MRWSCDVGPALTPTSTLVYLVSLFAELHPLQGSRLRRELVVSSRVQRATQTLHRLRQKNPAKHKWNTQAPQGEWKASFQNLDQQWVVIPIDSELSSKIVCIVEKEFTGKLFWFWVISCHTTYLLGRQKRDPPMWTVHNFLSRGKFSNDSSEELFYSARRQGFTGYCMLQKGAPALLVSQSDLLFCAILQE